MLLQNITAIKGTRCYIYIQKQLTVGVVLGLLAGKGGLRWSRYLGSTGCIEGGVRWVEVKVNSQYTGVVLRLRWGGMGVRWRFVVSSGCIRVMVG